MAAETGYLRIEDIVPEEFMKKPQAIVVEAGNGFGKTHSMSTLASLLQPMKAFDRIYILEFSQQTCENAVNKIVQSGGKVVWHQGLERSCANKELLDKFQELGIPLSYACSFCEYFKGKSRVAFAIFEEQLKDASVKIVEPFCYRGALVKGMEVCTQPIVRAYCLDPTFEHDYKLELDFTPVIVSPSQVMLNHTIIGKWSKYSKRQRKERKCLMVIDEADTVFYSSLKVVVPEIEFTDTDRKLLELASTKTKKVEKLEYLYKELYCFLKELTKGLGIPRKKDVERVKLILEEAEPLVRAIDRKSKQIIEAVMDMGEKTDVFTVAQVFEELANTENLACALLTVEETNEGLVMQDYDFGMKALLDTEFPWRFFWKIVLSATFPTDVVSQSRFLSSRAATALLSCKRRTKKYRNVYVSVVSIFPQDLPVLNRNHEIEFSVKRLVQVIKKAYKRYCEVFNQKPSGICIWLGNTKQYRAVVQALKDAGLKVEDKGKCAVAKTAVGELFISYVGSAVSRGIDLDKYDISIAVAPLLRPPRNLAVLDIIDFAKAVAETVQSAMRIVRSPKPRKPKLVVLEKTMTGPFYTSLYPAWFRSLFIENYVEIEEE